MPVEMKRPKRSKGPTKTETPRKVRMEPEGFDCYRAARHTGRRPSVSRALGPVLMTILVLLAGGPALAASTAPSGSQSGDRHSAWRDKVLHLSPVAQVFAIIGETLISEDLTCVTVGTFISEHKIPWLRGGAACF